MTKAHLTAIPRKTLSAPMRWLKENGYLWGVMPHKCLDYGCGRGFDADYLGFEKYDPYYFRCDDFCADEFEIITCNFVLNVIESENERLRVLEQIDHWLVSGGKGFISVRSDKKELKGYTKRGTYQGYHPPKLPLLHKGSGYEIYTLTK